MSEGLSKWWRELRQGHDLVAARRVETGALAAAAGTLHPLLLREQIDLTGNPDSALRLGRFLEGARRGEDLRVALPDLLTHFLAVGASGTGKTFLVLNALLALLRQKTVASAAILDPKGELATILTDVALPALAASLPPSEAAALLSRIVVVDPFSSTHLPPLNVLVRDPGIPIAIQSRDVAECFEAATETDVSLRMETILDWVLRLVIENRGSFHAVRRALQEPAVLEGLVRSSKDPDVVRYFVTRYPAEPKASKLALLARLDRFLALPMTQLCLGADTCLDFDRLLEDRIVIVSLGRVPAGLQSVARFFAMVIMTRYVRAIFRRPPRASGFASLFVADEWQMALNAALAAEFESILTLARSRGVHLWLANQQFAQLDRHGASLRSVVLGQTAVQVAFRLAHEDARTLRHIFPATGTMRRHAVGGGSTGAPFLTSAEEIETRMNEAARLPNRIAYFSDRRKPWGAIPMRSATLHLPDVSILPPAYVAHAQRGTIAFSIADLERMRRTEETWLDQLAAGPARVAAPAVPTAPQRAAQAPKVHAPAASSATPLLPPPPKIAPRKRPPRGGGLPPIR